MIVHRLSTIEKCNKIIEMKDGKIVDTNVLFFDDKNCFSYPVKRIVTKNKRK